MEQTSTNHSLLNTDRNDLNNELDELKNLLNDKELDFQEVYNYLDSLIKDVSKETVQKVLKFAKQYCRQAEDKENTGISL
jgi:DNA-binding transcriptional regulator GbsR (MarR family)